MPSFLKKIMLLLCFIFLLGVAAPRIHDWKIPTAYAVPGSLSIPSTSQTITTNTMNVTNLTIGGVAVTASAAELNRVVGVTSAIQTQMNLKAPIANPTFTGTVGGITATMVGLENVTNESKATMFTNPSFTGNVGIGTTAPGATLDVVGSTIETGRFGLATGDSYLRIGRPGTAADANAVLAWNDTNKQLQFLVSGDALGSSLNVTNGGNVGIGTTAPSSNLEIAGGSAGGGIVNSYATDADGARWIMRHARGTEASKTIVASGDRMGVLQFQAWDGAAWRNGAYIDSAVDGTPGSSDMPGRLMFLTTPDGSATAAERMRIDDVGNVGIGTTAPGALLTVGGATGSVAQFASAATISDQNYITLGANRAWFGFNGTTQNVVVQGIASKGMEFNVNNATFGLGTAMMINTSGNVGIGTTSPWAKLEVNGNAEILGGSDAAGGGGLYFGTTPSVSYGLIRRTTTGNNLAFDSFTGSAWQNNMVILSSNGNIGIKTAAPTIELAIGDTDTGLDWVSDGILTVKTNATERMRFDAAGDTTLATALDITGGSGTGYTTAPIEVRTTLTPRISFHWPGVVASQLGMDSAGVIRTYDNPGTGYAGFAASTGSFSSTVTAPTFSGALSGNATTASSISGYNNPTTAATANTIVYRDASGHITGNYIFGAYHNSSDDVSAGSLTYLMGKFGDNYYRSATAAKVAAFISGQSMNIAGNATTATNFNNGTSYSSGNYVYGGYNMRFGEIAGNGGLYRSTGWMTFYVENSGWDWRVGNVVKATLDASGNETLVGSLYFSTANSSINGNNSNSTVRVRNSASAAGKYWTYGPDSNNINVLYNQAGTGVFMRDGNTNWEVNSDQRLKTNIQTLPSEKGLAAIAKLNPVTYNWINTKATQETQTGFIAQEVKKVLPELVHFAPETTITLPDGSTQKISDPLGLNYTGFIPYLVKSIQEQQTQIISLESVMNDFIAQFKAGLIETKKLVVDGVDILKKLNELSDKSDRQQQTIDSQQKQIEEMKKSLEELKKYTNVTNVTAAPGF